MKEKKTNCGVYKIVNMLDGKIYVGSSISLKNRKYEHFRALRKGTHKNKHLQNAFIRDKEENFQFEIIEEIKRYTDKEKLKEELYIKENYWMEKLEVIKEGVCNHDLGYNMNPSSKSSLGIKRSEETIEKLKIAQINKMTVEFKLKLREYNLGNVASAETKKKMSDTQKRIGNKPPSFKGKNHTEESKQKMKDIANSRAKKIINLTTGEIFSSIREAEKKYNNRHIWKACKDINITCCKCKWSYYNENKDG
jgi:group I intron endonuclease